MKKAEIMNKMGASVNKVSLKLKKHSPEILIVAGIVGTVVGAVMACKATTKIDKILDEARENIDKIHNCEDRHAVENADETAIYTHEDAKKDLTIVYVRTGVEFIKLYAPAIAIGVLSITSILASNNILRKRNVALAAAYATVDKGFKEYRERVVERFGEQVDKELRHNIKAKEIEEITVDENGKEKKIKKTINVTGPGEFARTFDKSNPYWENNPDYNMMFLRSQQQYFNDLLMARGHVFLNEVYDALGLDRDTAGQLVGWVYDTKNPKHKGDNYIDFRLCEAFEENGDEYNPTILLDFNVDGSIYHLI